MSVMNIHRVLEKPVSGLVGSDMYMSDASIPSTALSAPHKAWRVTITSKSSGVNGARVSGIEFGTGQEGTHTNFGNVTTTNVLDNDNSSHYLSMLVGNSVGKIYDTPIGISTVSIRMQSVGGAFAHITGIELHYSDNTTDGSDGVWEEELTFTGISGYTAGVYKPLPFSYIPLSDLHIATDDASSLLSMVSHAEIVSAVDTHETQGVHIIEVADITARNALFLKKSVHIRVNDATADPSIESGPATYYFNEETGTYIITSGSTSGALLASEEW